MSIHPSHPLIKLNMNSLVRLLVLSLVASSTMAIPAPERADPDADVALPKTSLHDYIHHIDEDSIQHALQLFDKYRHGASRPESESSQEDSVAARMNLVKRSPANSSAAVDPTQPTAAPSTQAPTTSDSSSSSSTSQSDDTTSASSTAPTTTSQSSTTTAATTSSSSSETTSSSQSSASTTPPTSQPTSASSTSSSSSTSESHSEQSSKTTDEPTTSPTTTQGPRTTTFKSTTTLPNGQQSTVTQVTVIHPTQTATAASRTGPAPGLQTDSAASTASFARELWLMVGGAALVAMAL
ncbi:hypothetical protein BJX96DRAFT_141020 [Aspergillus floccosus]